MEIKEFLLKSQFILQYHKGKKISQKEMANMIGINYRTYVEYLRGTNEPIAMTALLNILSLLPDKDLIEQIRNWREQNENIY